METKVDARQDQAPAGPAVRSGWRRALVPVAILLALCFADRGGRAAVNSGIDPLDVLDLTVKNNVLFVLDTSGSMSYSPDDGYNGQELGVTDDPTSRMFQAKDAIQQVTNAQNGKVNFGLASFNILNAGKRLVQNDAPLLYASADAIATDWLDFFNGVSNTFTDYNEFTSNDVFRSFHSGPKPIGDGGGGTGDGTNTGYPVGCSTASTQLSPIDLATPANMRCRFYLRSKLYRNNTRIQWNRSAVTRSAGMTSFTTIPGGCPLPPAGLVGHNPDADANGFADNPTPCIQLQDSADPTRITTFYFSGSNFENFSGSSCGGAAVINGVSECDDPTGSKNQAVIDSINTRMRLALPVVSGQLNIRASGTGSGLGAMEVTPATTTPLAAFYQTSGVTVPDLGLSSTQSTPLGRSFFDIRTSTFAHPAGGTGMFPPRPAAAVGLQKNFVIMVTDGDDTCEGAGSNDADAVSAAKKAEDLFYESKPGARPANFDAEPTDPQHQASTFLVAFGVGIAPARANVIAQGGSGAIINTALPPATAATCPAGKTCRNAFVANNTAQLVDALNQAIALAASSGTFAASPGVVDNVFEYAKFVAPVGTFDPLDPLTRFKTTSPVLMQPTFDLPGFKGHLTAFSNKATAPACPTGATEPVPGTCQLWDAGQKLFDRVTRTPTGTACTLGDTTCMVPVTGEYTFAQLMGTATLATVGTATDLRIRRRIFSTQGNGVAPATVALWPPSTAGANTTCATDAACASAGNGAAPRNTLAGASADPLGSLDVALGIGSMDFTALQTEFLACTGTPLPPSCTDTTGPAPNTNQVRRAKREAREIMLASAAGTDVILNGPALKRSALGEVLFKAKDWMLAESSYASSAIITRSPDKPTDNEKQEWTLFRDGPRSGTTGAAINAINLGFGNRNPDKDGTAGSAADLTLKPFMTFVLYPGNDMLHAFRAGLCPSPAADCNGEGGGEEMWGFIPYDQLGKLINARKQQSRATKVYMMASSIRFGDVFIRSAPFTVSGAGPQTYLGRWKKMVYFGRGLGGKYYTGLDVTLTGPFTRHSLKTTLPTVAWNRGNPDTNDGFVFTGAGTQTYNNSADGPADYAAYLGMGETWSVPAVTRVDPTFNVTARTGSAGVLFALYTGSGFTDVDTEGTTFYALDSLTGDVIHSKNIGDNAAAASGVPATLNALVADAAAFQPNALVPGTALPNPANEVATRVFIGDVHGRLWKFRTDDVDFSTTITPFADLGPDQPIGVPVGLLNYDSTGSEGLKPHIYVSAGGDRRVEVPPAFQMFGFKEETIGTATAVTGFPIDLPPTPLPGFRGTVQPTTAFNANGLGRVFFTGTRFNPPGANCVSTFTSIIFAVTAGTAQASYDLNASGDDRFVQFQGKVITPPNTGTGQPDVVTGDRISAPPPPPPEPQPIGVLGGTQSVYGVSGPGGSPLYRMISSVCN